MAERRPVTLATVGAPHGVRGEVRVKSFTADPLAIDAYGPLFARDGRAFEIERLRAAKGVLIVKFRDIDDRNAAEALKGLSLFVDRTALPAPADDEFYHADLIGLRAVDSDGADLGKVVALHNHGAGDILEIATTSETSSPSLLVPFTKASVPDIDIAGGRLTVVLPDEIEMNEEET